MLARKAFIAKTDKIAKAGTQRKPPILKWRLFQTTFSISYFS